MTGDPGSLRRPPSLYADALPGGAPISLQAHLGAAPDGWDDTVRALGGSIFHSALWGAYRRRADAIEPLFLLGRDPDGAPVAAGLALETSSSRAISARLFRDLRLTAHPVVRDADPGLAAAFMRAVERLARTRGCTRLELDSFMSGTSPLRPAEHGFAETERVEFSLDLLRDAEALWQGIRKDQREKIRRLKREGVVITEGTSLEDLRTLGVAREATQARRDERGQGYDLPTDGGLYEALYRHLMSQGAARLFIARQADTVLAAILFSTFNGRAYSVFSGSTENGYRLGTQSGLFWAAVETFKAEDFRELNRGGVPGSAAVEGDPLHGIYTFKLRLGTTPQGCRSGVKVLNPLRHGLRRFRDRLRRAAGGR